MREVRLTLSGFVILSALFCSSAWIAMHALWKLQATGQGISAIIWPGALFGLGMGFITYVNRK